VPVSIASTTGDPVPMTFLSHQAVVLPLKIAAPRWTSGTALVLGSMAPDVEYFLRGYPMSVVSHTWLGQLTFCLPVTLVLYWVVTRVIAEPVAAHVPEGGEMHLHDYALLRHQPSGLGGWAIVAASALIGSSSHVALDRLVAVLGGVPYHSMLASRAWIAVNVALWVVLAAISLLLLRHIGRHRLLRRWVAARVAHESAEPHARQEPPRVSAVGFSRASVAGYWGWVLGGLVVGAALAATYRRPQFYLDELATWVHIWLCAIAGAFVALVLVSLGWHATRARSVPLRDQEQ
jgi:hypothetical protein